MADKTLVFFQTLINDPSVSKVQRKKVMKMRKRYFSSSNGVVLSSDTSCDLTEEEMYEQPQNVTRLLSKFDKGNVYEIILYPKKDDDAAFKTQLPSIQQQLIKDVQSTSIPKTLKALLYLFVLGKYGTYTEWIGAGRKRYSLTCASKKVKELQTHPLNAPETAPEFKQFGQAITVDSFIVNKILDSFEKEYCQQISLSDILFVNDNNTDHLNGTMVIPIDTYMALSDIVFQRILIRSNLDKVWFHTNTNIFHTGLVWLLTIIVKHAPKNVKIWASYEETNSKCSIVIKHSREKSKENDKLSWELAEVKQKMSSILAGYAEVTAEACLNKEKDDERVGGIRLYLVKESPQEREQIELNDDCITYRLNFHRS